ncbi:MAG: hypothetical protein IPP71_20030 [Bacteroidetes bacterium]|nr:hypothetical protein [Bacteroidota bacterium]
MADVRTPRFEYRLRCNAVGDHIPNKLPFECFAWWWARSPVAGLGYNPPPGILKHPIVGETK